MLVMAIIYIAYARIGYGVEKVYGSTVVMGSCGPRVSTGRPAGAITAAYHCEDSLD